MSIPATLSHKSAIFISTTFSMPIAASLSNMTTPIVNATSVTVTTTLTTMYYSIAGSYCSLSCTLPTYLSYYSYSYYLCFISIIFYFPHLSSFISTDFPLHYLVTLTSLLNTDKSHYPFFY